jgi:hypothetical protein
MAIFEITATDIRPIPQTNFAKEGLKERTDLQRLLQRSIEHISPDTMVLAEEFGSWDGSLRRIDLLGLDKNCRLVVIELKRTDDGGHMELQALRYAAMVSAMKFDDAVVAHRKYLDAQGRSDVDARANILAFLGAAPDEEPVLQPVRIVLAAADFNREITTTVLWLNTLHIEKFDVRCVRLRPHSYADGRVLLDIQQVIPLPEAAEYQIAIQQKAAAEVQAERGRQMRDFTKYDLRIGDQEYHRLSKRDLAYYVMHEAARRGFDPDRIHAAMPWKTNSLFVTCEGGTDDLSFAEKLAAMGKDPRRYFSAPDELFHVAGMTYALTNQWGAGVEDVVKSLLSLLGNPADITYTRCE